MVNKILNNIFTEALDALNISTPEIKIIKSNRPDLCDYQFDGLFKIAASTKTSPIIIGNKLVEYIKNMPTYSDYFADLEFAKPGFINITLSDKFINETLIKMNNNPKFNIELPPKETYVIDYGGYNIAKPLHIGHLRPTIIGESIKRILNYYNQNTIADVHLGDFGLQMGQVIYGILEDKKDVSDITIDYLNIIYPKISNLCKEDPNINSKCADITKSLQDNKPDYLPYWHKIIEVSLEDIKKLTNYFDVHFDLWEGESDAYKYFKPLEDLLNQKHLLKTSEGAQIIEVKKDNDNKPMPPMIFKKSNGAYLYDSTDLATIYERHQKFNPDHIIYVTDFRQGLHFEQVFRASELAGLMPHSALEHAYNGTINGPDGKPFKTRKGDAPKLAELIAMVKETFLNLKETNKDMNEQDLNIIVNAIIKFADLQNSREKDYIFDLEKFCDVVGKTGPYILYTYVRINKVIKNYPIPTNKLSNNIYNKQDRDLRICLLDLENQLNMSYINRMPSYIANYIYNLSTLTNIFYQVNHLTGLKDEEKLNDWLYILKLTNTIIKEMLTLLAIDVPSAM
jgi:arginyl-tRNA synthetase